MACREFPAVADRVETGPIQFGDDWPGIFIRGDNAAHYALWLDMFLRRGTCDEIGKAVLRGLVSQLRSCDVRVLNAQGMAAATAGETGTGSTAGHSPVPNGNAPNPSSGDHHD